MLVERWCRTSLLLGDRLANRVTQVTSMERILSSSWSKRATQEWITLHEREQACRMLIDVAADLG